MDENLKEELVKNFKGEILDDIRTLDNFSHDASIFEIEPKLVAFPKDVADVKNLVKFVSKHKADSPELSLTARSAGTDMSGGPLNDSIIVGFQKFLNKFISLEDDIATVQPGMFYRDFEKVTLEKDLIFASYPASREICAIGGIVNNNSGGEKSLQYGKTERYIKSLKVVLADGNEYTIRSLTEDELEKKISQKNFEGQIYERIFKLISSNYEIIQKARPQVSKNSAGFYLWNVYNKKTKIFDLTQLFVGSQGTLGLVTEASIKLIPVKKHSEMMIIFLNDLKIIGEIIKNVLMLSPESFETYDEHTLKLAIKFFPSFTQMLGAKNIISTALHFLPEFLMILKGGLPKLVMQVEFTGNDRKELDYKIEKLLKLLKPFPVKTRVAKTKRSAKKYWLIRRESFNLLRHKIRDKHAAPFIDDFVVKPEYLSEFLPKLNHIFNKYPELVYTIAGHLGDGNFHIIPLMNVQDPRQRQIIPQLSEEVFDLVLKYHGSTNGEHNDGLIRTPFLQKMYGNKMCQLFEETKQIFDPQNIFNPRKKVNADLKFALNHIRTNW